MLHLILFLCHILILSANMLAIYDEPDLDLYSRDLTAVGTVRTGEMSSLTLF